MGISINNLRYADDTALLTCDGKDLQELVTAVNDKGKPYGMEMNFTQGRRKWGRGQIAPGPQGQRGLITPNASRCGGSHKVNQQ